MRKCKKCGVEKDEVAFYRFQYKGQEVVGNGCKKCIDWKHSYKKKVRQFEIKRELFEKLGNKCKICGNNDYRVLEFHHIDSSIKNKKVHGTESIRRMRSYKKEIDNLELICANCHRIHNFETIWANKFGLNY